MSSLPQIAVVQLGARNHYLTATILNDRGMLHRLYTDAYALEDSWQTKVARQLATTRPELRRVIDSRRGRIPDSKVSSAWSITLMGTLLKRMARRGIGDARADAQISRLLTKHAERNAVEEAAVVYGYSSGCPELFSYARRRGVKTVLDQASVTVAVSQRILQEEMRHADGWESHGPPDMTIYAEREREELKLADLILAPSDFVRKSLLEAGVEDERIGILPYSYDFEKPPETKFKRRNGPLNVLFLGNVSLQKGIRPFLSATKLIDPELFRFRVVGNNQISSRRLASYKPDVEFVNRVPRNEVAKHYQWADVFVMPSLCDGFGMVQLEAAHFGLPMIVTYNCGYIVRDGIDGFVVEAGDEGAIAECLQRLESNPEMLETFSRSIKQRLKDYSVDNYSQRLLTVFSELF